VSCTNRPNDENQVMKYVIVIPDGCADEPQSSLDEMTPLQAARKPNTDRLAALGMVGTANNVPPSLTPASDVATLSLFGYDPLEVYTGRAPLEAAAMGIHLGPEDWAIRCNLVTVENETMRDFTAGHISSQEGKALIESLQRKMGGPAAIAGSKLSLEFHPGVSYRNVLILRSLAPGPITKETRTQAPHDIPDLPIREFLPAGPGSELLQDLMMQSRQVLAEHPVNISRRQRGERMVTQVWLWGQGLAPRLRPFAQVYGKRGAIISAVDLVRGVGVLLGWTRIDVPTATGYLDTDYLAKGRAGMAALQTHDLVCVHIEAPDEASHEGRADEKVKALERIDEQIVGPLLEALPRFGDWRMLVSPDHRTTLRTRAHARGPVPFVMAGTGIAPAGHSRYDEITASRSHSVFDRGHELIGVFLGEIK
jgi:2,3-bisphosphoglycerate-independent phosphoglycerate mutase